MKSDVENYISEIVEPTLEEFGQNPTSMRHAFFACVSIFHTIDYMTGKGKGLRQKFRLASRDFADVDRIAHAFKHAKSDGIKPLTRNEIMERPPGLWDQAKWDLSFWDDPKGGVTIFDERTKSVLQIARSALGFIKEQL